MVLLQLINNVYLLGIISSVLLQDLVTTSQTTTQTSFIRSATDHYLAMSFGYGVGDIMAVSRLALKVYTAYKDAPGDYRNIADEVKSFHIIINEVAPYFESTTTPSSNKQHILESCQNLLRDLDALMEEYKALAPANTSHTGPPPSYKDGGIQSFQRIKFGTEDIATLRARLISNTTLLNSYMQRLDITTIIIEYIMLIFQRSCDSREMQAQFKRLNLRHTSSKDSLISFAASINTKKVFRKFFKDLVTSGITAEMIKIHGGEICNRFKPTSSHIDVNTIADQSQLPRFDIATNTIEYITLISRCSHDSHRLGELQDDILICRTNSSDSLGLCCTSSSGPLSLRRTSSSGSLSLRHTSSSGSLVLRRTSSSDSLISFFGSPETAKLFRAFCQDIFEHGVTKEMLRSKVREVLNMFEPPKLPEVGNSTSPLPTILIKPNWNRTRFAWARPLMDFLVCPLMLDAAEASIQAINHFNDTSLHLAARNGHTNTVELLLSKGVSIEAINHLGKTPLHFAAMNGHTSTVELLLSKGASIEAMDHYNDTPLHHTARNGHTSIVELLLLKGASIEAMNYDNNTPLYLAAWYGHTSIVELLLSKGASIEAMNKDNDTPLHLAASNNHTSTVELLLSKGVSIEAMNYFGKTPLHLAARNGHTSAVELLLTKGASTKAVNKDNNTPLHLAAGYGNAITVELLLSKGASFKAMNKDNDTPLHLARLGGHISLARHLKRVQANP